MTPPPSRAEEAGEWLRAANRDLRMAELALGDNPPLAAEAAFHAQQAVEKAVKAFLVWHRTRYPLTHDIRELLQLCASFDAELVQRLGPAIGLTQFAVRFRYPGAEPLTEADAADWLSLARQACEEIRERLPPGVGS